MTVEITVLSLDVPMTEGELDSLVNRLAWAVDTYTHKHRGKVVIDLCREGLDENNRLS